MKYFSQSKPYTCGPACARMMLHDMGIVKTEDDLVGLLDTNDEVGTRVANWLALSSLCTVQTSCDGTLPYLRSLIANGWQVTVMVDDGGVPHYLRYTGHNQYKVFYMNPRYASDAGMKMDKFVKQWTDRWYVALR